MRKGGAPGPTRTGGLRIRSPSRGISRNSNIMQQNALKPAPARTSGIPTFRPRSPPMAPLFHPILRRFCAGFLTLETPGKGSRFGVPYEERKAQRQPQRASGNPHPRVCRLVLHSRRSLPGRIRYCRRWRCRCPLSTSEEQPLALRCRDGGDQSVCSTSRLYTRGLAL